MNVLRRRRARRVVGGLAAAIALCLCVHQPAVASDGEARPRTPSSYRVPTASEIAAKRAEAAALTAKAGDQQRALDSARTVLSTLQQDLDAAVAAEAAARAREEAARADEQAQQARLASATSLLEEGRATAGQLAAKAYRGDQLSDSQKVLTMFTNSADTDLGERLHMVGMLSGLNNTHIAEAAEARAVQADAATRAEAAKAAAEQAHEEAAAAQASAQVAVNKQNDQMVIISTLLAGLEKRAREAAAAGDRMAAEKAKADARAARAAARGGGGNRIIGPVDNNCRGSDISGYANGRIPSRALCALYAAPGHRLRADAAKAFNDMSVAYAGEFGAPICVTDSYRPLAVQRDLKRRKPHLAATPGRSNHGMARAVDLCGGIQGFGTAQHVWMRNNAPRFGWCHPYWARASGSKPEAWHWQFLDCNS